MRDFYEDDESEGVLLVDADNAFNRINREAVLWNTQFVCPMLKFFLTNTYRMTRNIFVQGGQVLKSQEGTTQGDPLAMAMYSIALAPLLQKLQPHCKQVWFADDGTGCDSLIKLKKWWDALQEEGPAFGYFPKQQS